MAFIFHFIYGMSSFPLTNSHLSSFFKMVIAPPTSSNIPQSLAIVQTAWSIWSAEGHGSKRWLGKVPSRGQPQKKSWRGMGNGGILIEYWRIYDMCIYIYINNIQCVWVIYNTYIRISYTYTHDNYHYIELVKYMDWSPGLSAPTPRSPTPCERLRKWWALRLIIPF